MIKSKAILKIERILKKIQDSSFDESHVDVLFVTLRELPKATYNIREIGAFVAHGNVRDQGLVNDIMLRNHLFLNLNFGKDKERVDNQKNQYPSYFPELVRLQLKLFNDESFKDALNLKGGQVQRARANLNKRNAFLIDGDICRPSDKLGINESRLVTHAMSLFSTSDGIDYNLLVEEVINLLKDEIDMELLSCLQEKKREVFCFLLLLLNQVDFSIRKDVNAKTIIHINENGIVGVSGSYPVMNKDGIIITVISDIFTSHYHTSEIFEGDLSEEDIDSNKLEISSASKKIIKKNM